MKPIDGSKPTVAVIIPTYNSAATLVRAVESALHQQGAELEIIIADDGSSDATLAIANDFGSSVKVISQQHAGPAAARNLAIEHSSGEFLAFLDSDDEWLPGRVSKCIAPMLESPTTGLTWCRAIRRRLDGGEEMRNLRSPSRNRRHRLLWPDPLQCTPATTCRRAALEQVGNFDEALSSREDKDLWIRIGERYQIVEIPEPLVIVHDQVSGYVNSNRNELDSIRADYLRIVYKALARNPGKYQGDAEKILAEAYHYWGQYALYYGFTTRARADLARSMKHSPSFRTGLYSILSLLPEPFIDAMRKMYRTHL